MNSLNLFILISSIIVLTQEWTGTTSTTSFYDTNVFTRSQSQNTLYAVGTSNYNVYRLNYTRLDFPSTLQYKLTHTDTVRTMTASSGQRYLATGSQDYHIQIWQIYPKKMACKFPTYNQLRKVIFHPAYEEILFAASVDDMIRKYNISNCSKLVEKSVGWSVHSMSVSDDGNMIYYGTLEGHVGTMDTNLSNNKITLNAHRFTVLFIFNTYPGYYVSIGDDSKMLLWNSNGNIIATMTSLSAQKLIFCSLFGKAQLINQHRIIGCSDRMQFYSMTKVTNTTLLRASTHQCGLSYSSIKWMDFRWIVPDEGQWVIHQGTSLIIHKITYSGTTTCNPQLAAEPNLKICRHCGYLIPGCYQCTDSSTCTLCSPGTYQSGGLCPDCPAPCSLCTSATSCSTCAVGFQPNGGSGNCVAQTKYQAGCYTYTSNGNGCSVSANGYFITGSVVKPCNQTMTACLECTESSSPQCLTCKTGYFVAGSGCTLCSTTMATMSGCLACSNSTVCLKCAVAFKYYGSNLQCSNCHPTCQTCLTFYDQCSLCYPTTQFRYLKDTSCLCMDGYYDIQSTGVYVCPLCSSVLSYCYLCTNNTICIQCQAMYYTVQHGSKLQCELCNMYCQSCQGASTYCTSCNYDNYKRILVNNNCVCESGYTMVNNSIPCSACGKFMDGCLNCTTYSYCTSCDVGYILVTYSLSNKTCLLCPYYCPDCGVDNTGKVVCLSCPSNSFRTLVNGNCTCDSGYFDDNNTVVCERCSDVLSNCLTCVTRKTCLSCAPGMYTDASHSLCAPCQSTCLTCGLYYDTCSTCDPGSNRILSGNKCVCKSDTYQDDGVCILCETAIPHCNSCTNQYLCTGCMSGFTLMQDLSGCIDCKAEINGCETCTSKTNCTTCLMPFTLIQKKCRCPNTMYTSKQDWGSCVQYGIPGLKSGLGVQIEVHQHQNNRIIVFIRFRAKNLYVLNKTLTDSIRMSINGIAQNINFDSISNNKVQISTEIKQALYKPTVTITFSQQVFFNEYLLTLSDQNYSVIPTRLYVYQENEIKTYESTRDVLKYTFYILKWVFFVFCIIGQAHLLFPFVVIIQLLPIFLMLNMSLPANLSMVLDALISFQVKSIIPLFSIKSKTVVIFPPMTYDYYGLYDFFLLGKIGDMLLIVLVNVMTKFDEGIVRMFPPGRIRRYLYESLVRRGYAAMSLSILSFQPSFILVTGVYITYVQWESSQEIFNYCCCLFTYGFYLAYNFNHASNLQGSKLMKNIQNENCFLDINSQQPSAPKTTLLVLVTDFWIIGSFHLVGAMVYFPTTIVLLVFRIIIHLKKNFYIGRIQFALRTLSNIFILTIFCIMYVYYLGESKITLTFETANYLGLVSTILIFLYMLCYIVQKILYNLKLETDFIQTKLVENQNGEQVIVAKVEQLENGLDVEAKNDDNQSSRSHKMKQFFNNTSSKENGGFSGLNFRNRNNNNNSNSNSQKDENNGPGHNSHGNNGYGGNKQDSNEPFDTHSPNNSPYNNSFITKNPNSSSAHYNNSHYNPKQPYQTHSRSKGNTQQMSPMNADNYFKNSLSQNTKQKQKQKQIRMKSANTSRYARNHLELRYKAQNILTKKADQFQE